MTAALRSLAAAVAILAVLLTAGAVGAARGQAMAAGEIVICAGGAAVTVAVDAEGKPTGPAHWCPDCVLSLPAGLSPAAVPAPPPGVSAARPPAPRAAGPGLHPQVPWARGPPVA